MLFKCVLLVAVVQTVCGKAINSFNGNVAGDMSFNNNANDEGGAAISGSGGAVNSFNNNMAGDASMNNNANTEGNSEGAVLGGGSEGGAFNSFNGNWGGSASFNNNANSIGGLNWGELSRFRGFMGRRWRLQEPCCGDFAQRR